MTPRSREQVAVDLYERQRAYLLAIFQTEQEREEQLPSDVKRNASKWQWLEYAEPVPELKRAGSPLYQQIQKLAKVDQDTPATFTTLVDHGLVLIELREMNAWGHRKPYLRLTTAGRNLGRQLAGPRPPLPKTPPPGTLGESHWWALAHAYAAGDTGLDGNMNQYGDISWRTWLLLREYGGGSLIEEYRRGGPTQYGLRITARGKQLYESEWTRYQALYPATGAPAPPGALGHDGA